MLIGGASARMGNDKALLEIDGIPLATRVASMLRAAGGAPVTYVGGTEAHRSALPGIHIPDADDVAGPAGGVLAALRWAPADEVVIAACDLVHIDPWIIPALRTALRARPDGTGGVAMPRSEGRSQAHLTMWSTGSLPRVEAAVAAGERALRRLLPDSTTWVELRAADDLVDVDRPEDLTRWTSRNRSTNG